MGKRVQDVQLLEPPVRTVVEGPSGPRVQDLHLAVVTYGALRAPETPMPAATETYWGPIDGRMMTSEALVLDVDAASVLDLQQALGRLQLPGVISWSRDVPSACDKDSRRTLYHTPAPRHAPSPHTQIHTQTLTPPYTHPHTHSHTHTHTCTYT